MDFKMNGDLLNLIDCTVKRTAAETVAEMKRQNLVQTGTQTPFQKTEVLLFNYNNFQDAIKNKEDQIKELKEYGLRKKSNSISSFNTSEGMIEVKSEMEKIDDRIEQIEESIHMTRSFIHIIDDALKVINDDPYYDLIPMRYFQNASRDDIAEHFGCDVKTVTRNKNRLINRLQIELFSDQVILRLLVNG